MQIGDGKKKYVIDIDNTICSQESDYSKANPYIHRIEYINKLYDDGHIICLFTARGYETGIDWEEITKGQLELWGVKYHELIFGKPSADFYIDDKAINACELDNINKKYDNYVKKTWGYEQWLKVTDNYVMKKLVIEKNKSISKQFHSKKEETWYINKGHGVALIDNIPKILKTGDVQHIPPYLIHKITAIEELEIIECSTIELYDVCRLD